MNEQEFYTLKVNLSKARNVLDRLKAEKLELRKDRWELTDFKLGKQVKKFEEEYIELLYSHNKFMLKNTKENADALMYEIADCQNVLDGIAYLTLKYMRENMIV